MCHLLLPTGCCHTEGTLNPTFRLLLHTNSVKGSSIFFAFGKIFLWGGLTNQPSCGGEFKVLFAEVSP